MKIIWNDNTIRWFHDASQYTGFHRKLSALLMTHIPHRNRICDMGCGTAIIDFELANYFKHITCVDISSDVIAAVNKKILTDHIENMDAVCIDGSQFTGSYDTVLAIFHGGPNIYKNYYPLAKEQLIIVTHRGKSGTFSPKKHQSIHNMGVARTKEYLDSLGIIYTYLEENIEYGQPFATFEDAMLFMDLYGATNMNEEEKIQHLKSRLIKTENNRFPYYMPNQKEMGIFIINRKDNESN